ncbi:conserved hypothetical protein containing ACT do main [Formosa agariphila KMM 3901]|uniref:Aspartate kinase n=1 Tax=Formosa agariphila (strain DSM 15362 / KCTC 12365 / LMG 23005 / KMM 3901 / M-2Alg 35-1) TaxID=1347342 RepID=T2KQ77_FORAG|nr:hypothetical protein [Formosa agariphila]CDF80987.1 conserved hypothetical protein containing ACT do main [Formosa agariphila KMM 3901]
MRTIASCVEEILLAQPFLEEAISRNIVNYSALANELVDPITEMLRKPVKSGAIMMALRRYSPPKDLGNSVRLKRVLNNLGDITVRSNLSNYTYKNSTTLFESHAKVINKIGDKSNIFYAFTRGIHESNIVISSSEQNHIDAIFINEQQIGLQNHLSAISINLPADNTKIAGLYYQIFKRLAWEGITLYEVVSTTNEFTVLVEEGYVNKAFSAIKRLHS